MTKALPTTRAAHKTSQPSTKALGSKPMNPVKLAGDATDPSINGPTHGSEANVGTGSDATSASADPQGSATQAAAPGPGHPASAATSPRPADWDEIGLGSLVLATAGTDDGWWEALVIRLDGDVLTLKWRDFPREPTFVRRRTDLALLPGSAR